MTETAETRLPETAPAPKVTSGEKILPDVEAVLFSSTKPVREKELAELLEATPKAVAEALEMLAEPHRLGRSAASASRRSREAGAS